MKSRTTHTFWKLYNNLPEVVQKAAINSYQKWKINPHYPSLMFKKLKNSELYAVRVGLNYRALGLRDDDVMTWIWIGSHEDYNKLI